MTKLHLGDCLNGCTECAERYHEQFNGEVCDSCNLFQGNDWQLVVHLAR